MFSLFKRKPKYNSPPEYDWIGTDMHSHVLPGIDDGAPDVETAVSLVKGLAELGYRKLIATPHVMADLYPNTHETIENALLQLQTGLKAANMDISVHAAAEYFLDESFSQQVRSKAPLRTIKDNLILVEFSFANPPMDFKSQIFDLQLAGYQPILAHPERYLYYGANKGFYDECLDAGLYLQLNLLSAFGYYGKGALELAQYLLKKKAYQLVGTDLHHHRHLAALQAPEHQAVLEGIRSQLSLFNETL